MTRGHIRKNAFWYCEILNDSCQRLPVGLFCYSTERFPSPCQAQGVATRAGPPNCDVAVLLPLDADPTPPFPACEAFNQCPPPMGLITLASHSPL